MPSRSEALSQLTAAGEPFELDLCELYGQECRYFKTAPPTLHELYERARGALDFVVYQEERYSYEETYRAACRIATVLVEQYGIERGDRVAISMRNYPEWIFSFMAVTSIGAVAVAMNALWESDEMAYGLADSGAKVLLADQERLDRFVGCSEPPDLKVIVVRPTEDLPEGVADLVDLLSALPSEVAEMPAVDFGPNDDAIILYTSGSTGHPKGAVSCHRNVISALYSWQLDLAAHVIETEVVPEEPEHQPATLLAVPLFHATGSHAVFLNSFPTQRKIVSMYKWDTELAAELIEREHISSFIGPAAMTGDLVLAAHRSQRDLSSLVSVGGGGAPRAPEQVAGIDAAFTNALPGTGWGMTETNAIGVGIGGEHYLERPESSGRCSAVLELKVVDEAGAEVATGERGELLVRGTSVIRGYWNRPDANAETFVDGWLRTGDVAYLDEDGFLFIVDRIKDLVIRGGENIGCGEVEAALLEHPEVLEASVYAVPDERLGEEVGATVYCGVGGGVDEGVLREFLVGRLAKFKVPRYLRVVDEALPRIASGKIFKRGIREAALGELGVSV